MSFRKEFDSGEIGERLYDGYAWVVNVGPTPANLLGFHAEWLVGHRLPLENPALDRDSANFQPVHLAPSQVHKLPLPDYQIRTLGDHVQFWSDKPKGHGRGKRVYLIGFIKQRRRWAEAPILRLPL
jgi:hypothetical protein